jgi:hypothetical protein
MCSAEDQLMIWSKRRPASGSPCVGFGGSNSRVLEVERCPEPIQCANRSRSSPWYREQLLFREMLDLLEYAGYCLVSLEPAYADPPSGHVLQVDGIFLRCDLA